jgi:hypothetical protein
MATIVKGEMSLSGDCLRAYLPRPGETIEVREREGSPWRQHTVCVDNMSTLRWQPELWRRIPEGA